ncbi:MAG: glycosyltransferase family 4 protein [Candidatus Kapaibacterium sp.]
MIDAFDIELLNTGDPDGLDDIGRFNLHNVREALSHGLRCWGALLFRRPRSVYVPIDRAFWGFLRDLLFLVPARLLGIRVVIHLRAGRFDLIHDFGARGRLLARIGLGTARRAIVLGSTVRDVFGDYVPAGRIAVVPNGIDITGWPSPGRKAAAGGGSFHIVYLANLFRDKGAHIMLGALPSIISRVPNVRVSFAGKWIDTEFRKECELMIAENGLERHVEFLGVVGGDDKRRLLESADLVAFVPVKPEGSPWVVLEAMASARPVIGTPQGTMKEVILDGVTGYLIAPGDTAALADRVAALAKEPELRARLGEQGRSRLEAIYSETASHRKLAEVLLEAMGSGTN